VTVFGRFDLVSGIVARPVRPSSRSIPSQSSAPKLAGAQQRVGAERQQRAHDRGVVAEDRAGVEQQHHFGLRRWGPVLARLGAAAEPLEAVAVDYLGAVEDVEELDDDGQVRRRFGGGPVLGFEAGDRGGVAVAEIAA
jgi:hypothetical protein